jgi:hypothetical protein
MNFKRCGINGSKKTTGPVTISRFHNKTIHSVDIFQLYSSYAIARVATLNQNKEIEIHLELWTA